MSDVKLDFSGMDRVLREHPAKVEEWLLGYAEQMRSEIVLSFGTSPPGQEYQRGGVTHVASQPGYPPNVDTGALSNSIRVEKTGRLACRIEDGVEYGIDLEDGTEEIAARPFMRPVFDKAAQEIERDAKQKLKLD